MSDRLTADRIPALAEQARTVAAARQALSRVKNEVGAQHVATFFAHTRALAPGFLWAAWLRSRGTTDPLEANPHFGQAEAADLVDYLGALLYRSPQGWELNRAASMFLWSAFAYPLDIQRPGIGKFISHVLRASDVRGPGVPWILEGLSHVRGLDEETLGELVRICLGTTADQDFARRVEPHESVLTMIAQSGTQDGASILSWRADARQIPAVQRALVASQNPPYRAGLLLDADPAAFVRGLDALVTQHPDLVLRLLDERADVPPIPTTLIERLLSDPDAETRRRAITLLGRIPPQATAPTCPRS